ncbi:unnamed protein product [Protopolystoma xenopodis]|uniref:Uncharacterized protein n=1 Tax=Protopolystoma xenopodis TaxID=117903 RepID=A0A3S5AD15_9PLAT|nr:unnamed protein product [Protopolystoma xenopodis]
MRASICRQAAESDRTGPVKLTRSVVGQTICTNEIQSVPSGTENTSFSELLRKYRLFVHFRLLRGFAILLESGLDGSKHCWVRGRQQPWTPKPLWK